jgi:D-alanyl-D-alanine carboxypeptidase
MKSVESALSDILDGAVRALVTGEPEAPRGAVIRLEVPGAGFARTAAAGVAQADGTPLDEDTPFHVASIGKLCTAAMVLHLAESGALGAGGIDTPLARLHVLESSLLDRLHVRDGVARGGQITVRQLLTHTAGLGDAFNDDARGTAQQHGRPAPGGLSARFWRSLKARMAGETAGADLCARRWALWDADRPDDPDAGLLNAYIAALGAAPVALPGERFHYSDQGFVLLALIVERLGEESYAQAQRRRLIEPLGLAHTWMVDREPAPSASLRRPAEVWMNGVPVIASGANLGFDFGGGGQVSTASDLCRLLEGLRQGSVFERPQTAADMVGWIAPRGLAPPRVAMGLGMQRWASRFSGAPMTGHAGAWGAHLWFDPRTGASVAGTVNQRDDSGWAFRLLDDVHTALGAAAMHDEGGPRP